MFYKPKQNKSDKVYTIEEAKRSLESFCVYQERCHKEVREKLQKMKMIPEAIDEIIYHLIQHNFLNEERFACAFARGKFRIKKYGRLRIQKELNYKEISAYNIKKAMLEIDEVEYLKTLSQLAKKKWNAIAESHPFKKKQKVVSHLVYKGYELDLIYEELKGFE